MSPTIPSSTQWASNRKESNSLASNNPVHLFQYTTESLMWKNQISRSLQHLFLAIVMCYLFSLQKAAGELSCHFIKKKKKKTKWNKSCLLRDYLRLHQREAGEILSPRYIEGLSLCSHGDRGSHLRKHECVLKICPKLHLSFAAGWGWCPFFGSFASQTFIERLLSQALCWVLRTWQGIRQRPYLLEP